MGTVASSWFGWQHGIVGETCCMCSVRSGWDTLLYSAEDYSNWFGGHDARWRCEHECASKCESDWHHGRYFGCYDESHLHELDNRYGHRSGYRLSLWSFWTDLLAVLFSSRWCSYAAPDARTSSTVQSGVRACQSDLLYDDLK